MSQEELLDARRRGGSRTAASIKTRASCSKTPSTSPSSDAEDILIHRTDLAALPITATKEEVAALFTESRNIRGFSIYRRIPSTISSARIHQKDFYVGCGVTDKPLREILLPPVYALEMEPISQLLKKLQQAKTHVAVVVDEYGGTLRHRHDGGHSGGAGRRDLGRA